MGRVARLCSKNQGKLRELRAALPDWEIELLGVDEYPPEIGETYYENARAKADFGRTIEPGAVGDRRGLGDRGAPGSTAVPACTPRASAATIPSRACSTELDGVADRRARYVCELVALDSDGVEHRGTGTLEGRIVDEPRGSEGFGYDPIFVPDGEERTVAELGNDWKRSNSHRAQAADSLNRVYEASN